MHHSCLLLLFVCFVQKQDAVLRIFQQILNYANIVRQLFWMKYMYFYTVQSAILTDKFYCLHVRKRIMCLKNNQMRKSEISFFPTLILLELLQKHGVISGKKEIIYFIIIVINKRLISCFFSKIYKDYVLYFYLLFTYF